MADLSKVSTTTMEMLESLEEALEDGDEIGELMLLCQVHGADGSESLNWRCSSKSYLVQRGIIAWGQTAVAATYSMEEHDGDEEEE